MDEQERDHGASDGKTGIEETLEDLVQDIVPGAVSGDQRDQRA
jgi:hypothetical protein